MKPSIIILTHNEEINILDCLKSVKWSNDIVILDSYSVDQTINLAKLGDVRIYQRKFVNYADQRNWAINKIDYKNEWVLMIDADERVPDELREEIENVLEPLSQENALFRVRRKDIYGGRWIRHSSGYPSWFGRLIKLGQVTIQRVINEEYHTEGTIGYLNQHLLHYPFNKGIFHWVDRHNQYSTLESKLLFEERNQPVSFIKLFEKDPVLRRKKMKQLYYNLPFRPAMMFIYLYLVRGGFLDGKEGFNFITLRTFYEYMISLKIKEIRSRTELVD